MIWETGREREKDDPASARKLYTSGFLKALNKLSDAHIEITNAPPCEALGPKSGKMSELQHDMRVKRIAGGFGFIAAPLDNNKVIVAFVKPHSAADKAGIKTHWVLTQVDDMPVREWLDSEEQDWNFIDTTTYADKENRAFQKH